jgi:hypothetical protein
VVEIDAVAAAARTSDIARRRAARSAVALALLALAGPAAGQVGPRLVSLYPLSRTTADAGDVQALLDVALHRLAQRTGNVALGTPLVVRAACGPAASAAPDCLARLAGEGLVVRATVHPSGSALLVALHAVDGAGRSTGPVSTAVDSFIQSAEPLVNALQLLVDQVFAGDRRRARERGEPVAEAPPAPRVPAAVAPPAARAERPEHAPVEKPDLRAPEPPASAPAAAAVSRPPPARRWMRAAGPWVTGAGAVLVAGGLAVSTMNHSLSEELEDKLAAGRLTAADLDSYDRVGQYNTLSALLFASGGALTLGGVALWTAPLPRGPAVAGVAGRF